MFNIWQETHLTAYGFCRMLFIPIPSFAVLWILAGFSRLVLAAWSYRWIWLKLRHSNPKGFFQIFLILNSFSFKFSCLNCCLNYQENWKSPETVCSLTSSAQNIAQHYMHYWPCHVPGSQRRETFVNYDKNHNSPGKVALWHWCFENINHFNRGRAAEMLRTLWGGLAPSGNSSCAAGWCLVLAGTVTARALQSPLALREPHTSGTRLHALCSLTSCLW